MDKLVIDDGEHIYGYTDDVRHYIENKLEELVKEHNDDNVYLIRDLSNLVVALYDNDATFVKVEEFMGEFNVKVLED